MPTLTIRRDQGYVDKLRRYHVLVDGHDVGQVRQGESLRVDLAPGSHVIEARVDWCGSRPLRIEMGADERSVVIQSALRGWRLILGLYYIIVDRRGYLRLELAA